MALTFLMTIEDLEDKFNTMPGAHLHILWEYNQIVRTNLKSDLVAFRTYQAHSTLAGLTCQTGNSSGIPSWLDTYITSIEEDPALFDLTEFHMCLMHHARFCAPCRAIPTKMMRNFWKALTAVVHNSMTKVSVTEAFDIVRLKLKLWLFHSANKISYS